MLTAAEFILLLRQYRRRIAVTMLSFLAAACLYLALSSPTYIARTLLVIEPEKAQAAWAEQRVDPGQVESQAEILRSQKVSDEVIGSLQLTTDPEFQGPANSEADRLRIANAKFAERLNVRRIGQSYVIEIAFRSNDADKSARIANAIADAYLSGSWRLDKRTDRFRRFSDTAEREIVAVANARVITTATPPLRKSSPQTTLVLGLGILLGGLAGVGLALVSRATDRTVRSAAQVTQEVNLDCLGSLPALTRRSAKPARAILRISEDRLSPFGNALHSVKNSIDFAAVDKPIALLGITSPGVQEGKSVLAGNLAILYALSGSHPLLVDANFRNPALSRLISPQAKSGLIEALAGKPVDIISLELGAKIFFLPLVRPERAKSTTDLLKSRNAAQWLSVLQQTYSPIIFDLSSAEDARPLAALLDANILVLEWGRTTLEDVREAGISLESARASVLGTIINKRRV